MKRVFSSIVIVEIKRDKKDGFSLELPTLDGSSYIEENMKSFLKKMR